MFLPSRPYFRVCVSLVFFRRSFVACPRRPRTGYLVTVSLHETEPCDFIGFGAMGATKPYEFIGLGAMGATKPCEIIGIGAMDATKLYKLIGFGAMSGCPVTVSLHETAAPGPAAP